MKILQIPIKKLNFFYLLLAEQCSLICNSSALTLNLHYTTEKRVNTLNIFNNDIEKNTQNLDPNKAHRHDMFSIP